MFFVEYRNNATRCKIKKIGSIKDLRDFSSLFSDCELTKLSQYPLMCHRDEMEKTPE